MSADMVSPIHYGEVNRLDLSGKNIFIEIERWLDDWRGFRSHWLTDTAYNICLSEHYPIR